MKNPTYYACELRDAAESLINALATDPDYDHAKELLDVIDACRFDCEESIDLEKDKDVRRV